MNDIKTIGAKFARFIVGLNQESFAASLKDFINSGWFKKRVYEEEIEHIKTILLKGYEPIDTFFGDFDADYFMYHLVARINIEVIGDFQKTLFTDQIEPGKKYWLKMSYSGKMDGPQGLCSTLYKINLYSQEAYLQEKKIAPDIIPYLNEYELDNIAQQFLCQYAPDMLTYAMPLRAFDVAHRMGLYVGVANLPENLLGQLCFAPRTVGIYSKEAHDFIEQEVPRGTVLIRAEKDAPNDLARLYFSAIHECVHWARHRKFIDLCLLMDQDTTEVLECPATLTNSQRLPSDYIRMEWQANNLAARILVPTITAEKIFRNLLEEKQRKQPTWRNAVVMEEAIKRLAEIYQVSNETAKYRVIQLGYEQAAGVLNYVDGSYTVPISFADGALKPGQSFFAPDAVIEHELKKPELSEAYEQHRIVHVNKMLVCNHSKYVVLSDDGYYELTDYALEHADECCMVFETKRNSKRQSAYYSDAAVLNRDFMADDFKEVMCDTRNKQNHDILKNAEQGQVIKEQLEEYLAFYKTLPSDFGGTLKAHRNRKWNEIKELIKEPNSDYNNLTQEHLAERSMVSQGAIESYEGGDAENIKLGTVLSICATLRLHPLFTIDLVEKAGYNLFNGSLANAFYLYLIFYHHMERVEDWNLKLKRAGLSQLLPKRSDEVCEKLEEMLAELEKWEEENKK